MPSRPSIILPVVSEREYSIRSFLVCTSLWEPRPPSKCQKIIDTVPFVREAVSLSKWAFASDYIRLYAVYSEGGIYLDSDVYMYQSFDPFLDNRYFTNVEFTSHFKKNKSWQFLNDDGTKKNPNQIALPGLALQAAIFGGEAGHPFLKKCMEYYENEKFILPNGMYSCYKSAKRLRWPRL